MVEGRSSELRTCCVYGGSVVAPSSNWIKTIIALFAAIIFGASFITGQSIDSHGLKWISGASSAVIILIFIFDRWAWRWPLIGRITELAGRPIIHGTWKATLQFEKDGAGNPGKLTCYFSIYQTFSTVRIRGFFSTSQSSSLTATIDKIQPNQTRLVFAYRGEAPHGKREQNRPHDGLAMLNIIGRPVEAISGSYFTDRKGGAGTITMTEYSPKISESLEQAKRKKFTKRS